MLDADDIREASVATQAGHADTIVMPASTHNCSEATLQGVPEHEDHENDTTHESIQERYQAPSSYRFRRIASKTLVSFGPDDPENPVNWSKVGVSCQCYIF